MITNATAPISLRTRTTQVRNAMQTAPVELAAAVTVLPLDQFNTTLVQCPAWDDATKVAAHIERQIAWAVATVIEGTNNIAVHII